METKTVRVENLAGGRGHVLLTHVLSTKEMKESARMYAKVTIEPGCGIGFHKHEGESETYFILSGTGEYDDNGTLRTVSVGDVTFTPSGFSHAISNKGTEDLVFMALILLD